MLPFTSNTPAVPDEEAAPTAAASGVPAYGAVVAAGQASAASAPSAKTASGSSQPGSDRTWEWESRGHSFTLLMTVMVAIANQFFYLLLISMNVMYSKQYLMDCNPHVVGYAKATMCEWTKAHVRCFPILGLQVSVLVTSRTLLQHRVYYQMLKRGALVDFENFNPLEDPLFLILLTDVLLAVFHFALLFWELFSVSIKHVDDLPKLIEDCSQTAAFYVVPSVVFLSFLFKAYDTEQGLVPLSKYFDEDPEVARVNLSRMLMLPESKCAYVLSTGFWDRLEARHPHEGGIPEDVAFTAFIGEAAEDSAGTSHDRLGEASLSRWRLVSTLWPAKLLLTRRLTGEQATRFQYAWSGFSAFSSAIFLLTFCWLLRSTASKFDDILNGQLSTDWAGLLVFAGHIGLWGFLAQGFVANMLTRSLDESILKDRSK